MLFQTAPGQMLTTKVYLALRTTVVLVEPNLNVSWIPNERCFSRVQSKHEKQPTYINIKASAYSLLIKKRRRKSPHRKKTIWLHSKFHHPDHTIHTSHGITIIFRYILNCREPDFLHACRRIQVSIMWHISFQTMRCVEAPNETNIFTTRLGKKRQIPQ